MSRNQLLVVVFYGVVLAALLLLDSLARWRRWYASTEKAWPVILVRHGRPASRHPPAYRDASQRDTRQVRRIGGIPRMISPTLAPHAVAAGIWLLYLVLLLRDWENGGYHGEDLPVLRYFIVQLVTAVVAIAAASKRRPWLMLVASVALWDDLGHLLKLPWAQQPFFWGLVAVRVWLLVGFAVCHVIRRRAESRARSSSP